MLTKSFIHSKDVLSWRSRRWRHSHHWGQTLKMLRAGRKAATGGRTLVLMSPFCGRRWDRPHPHHCLHRLKWRALNYHKAWNLSCFLSPHTKFDHFFSHKPMRQIFHFWDEKINESEILSRVSRDTQLGLQHLKPGPRSQTWTLQPFKHSEGTDDAAANGPHSGPTVQTCWSHPLGTGYLHQPPLHRVKRQSSN